MDEFFMKLLNTGLNAGWLILAILCLRLIFRKMPKWMHCLLWAAAAIRLICPFTIESPFSMLPSAELIRTEAVVDGEVRNYIPSIDSSLSIVEDSINPMLAESFAYSEAASAAPLQIVTSIAGNVWACIMILLILCAIGSMIRLHLQVRESVRIRDNIYICDAVRSPFILGMFRPRIYLPSALPDSDMDYIISHETAHLKRKDHWWKLLGYLLLCIYWFQPLCWAAYAMLCKDIELACDEKLARHMTPSEKKEYSRVLLSCAGPKRMVMVCPLAFGEVGIRERVKSILNYKKPALWLMIAAATICILLAVCFLTDPAQENQASSREHRTETDSASSIEAPAETDMTSMEKKQAEADSNSIEEKQAEADSDSPERTQPETGPGSSENSGNLPSPEPAASLSEHPEPDKVCIEVQPPILGKTLSYFYIPEGSDQEWLSAQLKSLEPSVESADMVWKRHQETGWRIWYQDTIITGFEDGYLYAYTDAAQDIAESLIEAPKLCDYIQILLAEEIGYRKYDISGIKDLVSARLEVNSISTDWQYYSQTITDAETLQKFEEWFSHAEYIYGGADCGNERACLELTLADGNVVKLSMATDSCPNFIINGVAYDYRPEPDWDNSEFFQCFQEIPWNFP